MSTLRPTPLSFDPAVAAHADRLPVIPRVAAFVAELGLYGILVMMLLSPGFITVRQRILLGLLAIGLGIGLAAVTRSRAPLPGVRWLFIFAIGLSLSLAVRGEAMTRPPSLPAAICSIVAGAAGILALVTGRRHITLTGLEPAAVATTLVIIAPLLWLFGGVASQNGLDVETLHNTLGALLDYFLLFWGALVVSATSGSLKRSSLLTALALLIHVLWRHGMPPS